MAKPPDSADRLAERILACFQSGSTDALNQAALSGLIDAIGVGMAANHVPHILNLQHLANGMGESSGRHLLLVGGQVADPSTAIEINAASAHGLDHDPMVGAGAFAAFAVVAPVVMAMSEECQLAGDELLRATAVGIEVGSRLCMALTPGRYSRDNDLMFRTGRWFNTAVLGVVSAAVITCLLRKPKREPVANAVRLAVCHAGGLRAAVGTPAKSLLVGAAARAGFQCGRLAVHGVDGPRDVLESQHGFAEIFGDGHFAEDVLSAFGRPFAIESPGIMHKAFPVCSSLQGPLEALLSVTDNRAIQPATVVEVNCEVGERSMGNLTGPDRPNWPATIQQAQFDAPYCLARALLRGTFDASDLAPDAFADMQTQTLARRIRLWPLRQPGASSPHDGGSEACRLTLLWSDGRTLEAALDHATGSLQRPVERAWITEKFVRLIDQRLGRQAALDLADWLWTLDTNPAVSFEDAPGLSDLRSEGRASCAAAIEPADQPDNQQNNN